MCRKSSLRAFERGRCRRFGIQRSYSLFDISDKAKIEARRLNQTRTARIGGIIRHLIQIDVKALTSHSHGRLAKRDHFFQSPIDLVVSENLG